MNNVVSIVLVYIVISFIGILLHDFKYLFFLNSNNRVKAVIICGVYVIFNTMTTKLIADQPMQISIPVITVTNMISRLFYSLRCTISSSWLTLYHPMRS